MSKSSRGIDTKGGRCNVTITHGVTRRCRAAMSLTKKETCGHSVLLYAQEGKGNGGRWHLLFLQVLRGQDNDMHAAVIKRIPASDHHEASAIEPKRS